MKPLREIVGREASTEILSCGHRLARWERERLELGEGSHEGAIRAKARRCPVCPSVVRFDARVRPSVLRDHVVELRGGPVRVRVDASGILRRRA